MAQALLLGAQLFHAGLGQRRLNEPHQRVLPVEHLHLGAVAGGLLRRLDIAGIGQQPGLFPTDDHSAVGKGEARREALVLLIEDEQRVQMVFREFCLDSCDVVHIPVSSALGRGKLSIKTLPCGLFCPTVMLPPWASTASCTILSPRPLPPASRDRALSTR